MKIMIHFKHLLILVLLFSMASESFAQNPGFNKNKDFLLANFDLRPDEDDVMAAAALAVMLRHSDLSGVKSLAVAGAYGEQGGTFITTAVPSFYNQLFGAENNKWTNAHKNWNASVGRAKNKVKSTLNNGGKVFVAEAGQSDFTHDVLRAVIREGVSRNTVKRNVFVVQHSDWNEDKSNKDKLDWVMKNTQYRKIDNGNVNIRHNKTPGYNNRDRKWLRSAKSNNNPNRTARSFWTKADQICDNFRSSYENSVIKGGGVDFSDCVEIWWIFKIGNKADNVGKFWDRYVTNRNGRRLSIPDTENVSEIQGTSPVELDEKEMTIYPNPVQNVLQITSLKEGEMITVIGPQGRTVLKKQVSANATGIISLDVRSLENGIYAIKTHNRTVRFIKE